MTTNIQCEAKRQGHPRGEILSKDPVQNMRIYERGALRLSTLNRDRKAQSGKFPEDEFKAGRELTRVAKHVAFELVDELLHAHDRVWVDEWRGDQVRS